MHVWLCHSTCVYTCTTQLHKKNIFIFHDESTFNANDDEALQWGRPESQIIRPKSRGSEIMVSDFITEKDRYRCLTEEEYAVAHENDSNIRMGGRTRLEDGEARDGYWTGPKFMKQMESAVKVAEVKYPREKGYRLSGFLTKVCAIWHSVKIR